MSTPSRHMESGALQSDLPLKGLLVLDASRVLAGPLCAQILADLGARVIKIERPATGDETRGWGPPFRGDVSSYFRSCNRGKESVTLDLHHPEGKRLFLTLVKKADVIIENFKASSSKRMGLTPEELARENPRAVIATITGFPSASEWKDRPGYDFAIQALSGLMAQTGPVEGPPSKVGVAVTDVLTALYTANGIQAALLARQRTGQGEICRVSLFGSALAAQVNLLQAYLDTGDEPKRQGNAHMQIVPYQTFQTEGEDTLVLCVGNDGQWRRFCEATGRPDLAEDPRFVTNANRVVHRGELIPVLESLFMTKNRSEWEALLQDSGVPFAPVQGYGDLERLGLLKPGSLIPMPFTFSGHSENPSLSPPKLGEHTEDVLKELCGLSAIEIEELQSLGIA